jgi:hypothetical protein
MIRKVRIGVMKKNGAKVAYVGWNRRESERLRAKSSKVKARKVCSGNFK